MNQQGHPPDVTAQTITKEIGVMNALKGSWEMNVTHVLMVTMVIHVVTKLISFHAI